MCKFLQCSFEAKVTMEVDTIVQELFRCLHINALNDFMRYTVMEQLYWVLYDYYIIQNTAVTFMKVNTVPTGFPQHIITTVLIFLACVLEILAQKTFEMRKETANMSNKLSRTTANGQFFFGGLKLGLTICRRGRVKMSQNLKTLTA